MREQFAQFIHEKCPGAQPLFIAIRGSQAYGTATPTSDTDYAGVYIQSLDDILSTGYREQINDDQNDIVFYEVKRFLELVASNNPTILELLNTPEDCVIYQHPLYAEILKHRDSFLTKVCAKSFGGYAIQQIKKAKGQNKKQNWEKEKVTRKNVLDFVYVIQGEQSVPWKEWNKKQYDEKLIGAVNVPNARDVYALYFDWDANSCFNEKYTEDQRERAKAFRREHNLPMGYGYKGLVKIGKGINVAESNALRLSSIPKGELPLCNVIYNKDGYTQHCKDYASYTTWLKNRNEQRWVDVKAHGQQIDGKNMMHCRRLLEMAREIGEGRGVIVRRPNAEKLLAIRRGEVDLQSLIDHAESDITEIDALYAGSTLPESVSPQIIYNILVNIRKQYYSI